MKVQASALVPQQVQYIDYKTVTNCGSDLRQRPLAIDAHDRPCEHAIGIGSNPCDIEIICDGGSMYLHAQAEKKDDGKGKHGESNEDVQQSRPIQVACKTSCIVCEQKAPSAAQ